MAKNLADFWKNSSAGKASASRRQSAQVDRDKDRETLADFYYRAQKKGIDENPSTPSSRIDRDYLNSISSWVNSTASRLNTYANEANKTGTIYGAGASLSGRRQDIDSLMATAQEYMDYLQDNEDAESVLGTVNYNRLSQSVQDTLADLMRFSRTEQEANRGSMRAINQYLATDEGQAQIEPYLQAQEEAQEEVDSGLGLAQQVDRMRALQQRKTQLDDMLYDRVSAREYDRWAADQQYIGDELSELRAGIERQTRQNRAAQTEKNATSASDFAEYSQRGANIENPEPRTTWQALNTSVFDLLNGREDIANPVTFARQNQEALRDSLTTPWGTAVRSPFGGNQMALANNPAARYYFMTDEEVGVYNYLLAHDQEDGTNNAAQYLEDLDADLEQRVADASLRDVEMWASDNPVLASAASVAGSPLTGAAYLEALSNRFTGKETKNSPMDVASRGNTTLRSTVAQDIRDNVAERTGNEALGDAAASLYNVGLSILDSTLASGIGGAVATTARVGGAIGGGIMMGTAGTSAYQDAIDRGVDEDSALVVGGAAAIAEMFFERFSIENFLKAASPAAKNALVKNVIRQMGIEASEEGLTEISNIIADTLITQDLSNYQLALDEYMAQGMDESEARLRVFGDLALQVGESALGGALSGGVMGTAGTAISAGRTRSMASKAIRTNSVDLMIDQALTLDPSSASYTLAQQLRNGDLDTASSGDVARLVRAMAQEEALTPEIMERINTPVQEDAEAETDTQTLSEDDPLLREAQAMVEEVAQEQRARTARTESPSAAVRSAPAVSTTSATQQAPVTTQQATPSQTAQTPRREASKSGGTKTTARRKNAQKAISDALERARTSDTQTEITSAHIPAVDAQTNERIEIAGVDEVSPSGAVTLRADDGSVLAYSDVQFDNPRVKQLYDSVSALRNTNAARTFVSSYDADAGISVSEYASGFYPIYNAAIEGESFEAAVARSGKTAALSPAQQQAAYMAGQNIYNIAQESRAQEEAESAAKKQQEAPKKQRKRKPKQEQPAQEQPKQEAPAAETRQTETRRKGGVSYEIDESTLTDRQRAGLESAREVESVIDALARLGGAEVVIVPNLGVQKGGTAQGAFNTQTHQIRLALDSADAIEYVAVHELTHYIRQLDEESYHTLLNLASIALRDGGADMNLLVKEQMDTYGYSSELALEEVLCNTLPAMLSDADYVERLVKSNKTLVDRIRDFIAKVVETLRRHYEDVSRGSQHYQMRVLAHNLDALQEIERVFDASLAKIARENGELTEIDRTAAMDDTNIFAAVDAQPTDTDAGVVIDEGGVRYSIASSTQEDTVDVRKLTRDNKRLKDALENARAQVRIVRGSRIQQSRLERIANRFVREYKSKYDSAQLANELRQIYEIAESDGEVRFDDLDAIGIGIARKVVEQSRALDTDREALYSDLRDYLRGVTIRLTPELRQQITESYGSVGNFRRALRNLVGLDERKGIELDVLLGDIKSQYPWLETEDISPMTLEAIADLTRQQYINPFGDNIDSEAAYLWTRIQEAYADAQLPETFAERKKAEIDRLRKQMRELRNEQHAQDVARMRERLEKQREEYQQRLANQATAFREREARQRAKRNEGAERRRYRERIQASAKTLSDWLAAPSDKRFVPEYLRNAVAQYVANVDVGYRSDTKARQRWTDRMVTMLDAVRRASTAPPDATPDLEFDSETLANIEELTAILRNAPKNKAQQDMTVEEMKMLSDTLQAIKHQIINADKLFVNGRRESIATVGEDTIDRALGKKNKRHNDALKKVFGNRMAMGIMKPYYFFREMGGNLRTLGDDLFRGESDWAQIMKQERDWYEGIKKKYHVDRWANRKNDELKFTTGDGERVSLTREQAMYIYAVDNRERLESGTNHLRGGGIVTDLDRRGRPKDDSTAHALSNEDIQRISDWLTDEQKAYADELVSNLSTTMSAYGNRTSMRLVGYKKFTGEHYIPIRVHGDYVQSEVGSDSNPGTNQTRQSARLKNRGFTKSITQGANNPLVAADITDVWARHVQDMASYAALAIQQDNLIRVYNYKRPNMPGAQQATVKSALTTGYGRQTRQYLDRLNADIGGTVMVDPRDSLMSAMLSRFKKGAVMASLSVAIQQPTAYLRALAVLPARDMRPGWLGAFREAQRYAGTAIIKEIGGFDMQTGGSATDWLRGSRPKNIVEWADEIGGILPEKADAITWGAIWNSVKQNVRRTTKLKPGSQEFFQECGKRFDNVIRMTQVYDSTLSRADFMRGKSQYLSMVTSFMAEPMTSMNLLIDSIYHQKDKRMQGRVSVRAAAVAFAASTIINAVAKSVVYAMRDDDDELTFWEKYQQELRNALLGEPNAWIPGAAGQVVGFLTGSDLSPLGQLPIISDMASMVQGYDVSRTDMDAISRVVSAAQALLSDNRTTYYKIREFVGAVSTLVGVPVRNLWRDVEGVARTIGAPVPATSTNESTQTGSFQRAYQALIDGDKTAYQRYMDRAEQMIRESMDKRVEEDGVVYLNYEVEVQNRLVEGLRDALKEDPRIQQMARYISSEDWDLDQYERMRAQLIREGFPEAAITGAVNSARNDIEDTGEIESTPYGPDEWTRDDLQLAIENAIQTGDLSDVEAIQQDMLTQSDTYWQMIPQAPEDYVKAAARKAYQATGVSSNDRNALRALELFGYTQEDVVGWEQDEMRQTMYDLIDAGDYRQANQQIAKMRNSGMDADGIRDGVRTKYKKLIQDAQVAGDTQRVRELRSTLMNLNLYTSKGSVYFTSTMIDEWIRDAGKEG